MSVGTVGNPTAFSVYTNYAASANNLSKSMNRLATGVKSVVDDGAGVGISERMRSQARSTAMARNNVENSISALQTADGWMQRVSNLLGRMHELAVEAQDATKSTADKTNIQAEFSALQDEIGRIGDSAGKFNGDLLFDGGFGGATQVGADTGQTITISLTNLRSDATTVVSGGTTWGSINHDSFSVSDSNAIDKLQKAINFISEKRAAVGGLQSRMENTRAGLLTYEDNIRSAESKIRDVDAARESSLLMKSQIQSQIGNAMLAQANQLPQYTLQLI